MSLCLLSSVETPPRNKPSLGRGRERERERERERGLHNLELFQSKGGDIVILKSIIRPIETVAIRVLKSTDAFEEVEREELGSNY
ncbi:unnamed protein product [Camellia sinensis]